MALGAVVQTNTVNVDFNSLPQKTGDIFSRSRSGAAYIAKLDLAKEQIKNGQVVYKTMAELRAMADE